MDSQIVNLMNHNWEKILDRVESETSPNSAIIIDGFLDENLAKEVHKKLIEHWGWFYRHPSKPHLTNNSVLDIDEIKKISDEINNQLKVIDSDICLENVISIRNNQNTKGILHADNFDYTITLWLTPEEYNLDNLSGGMRVYDVSRPVETLKEELEGKYWCEGFLNQHSKGKYKDIKYKFNRAVFFKPRTLHQTHNVNFSTNSEYSHRINLTFTFNNSTFAD